MKGLIHVEFIFDEKGIRTESEFGELVISGDENEGFRPFQLMISSLAGCSILVYRKILEKQRVEYEKITVSVDVERSDDQTAKIESVRLHFKVYGDNLKEKKLDKALQLASKNCSMVQSVVPTMEVEETVEAVQV